MFFEGICGSSMRKATVGVRVLTAFCLFALTVLQGLTLCLCAPDPNACDGSCQACGAGSEPSHTHIKYVCDHLEIAAPSPGVAAPNPLDELLSVLALAVGVRVPAFEPRLYAEPVFLLEHPPDVRPLQLIFIARSAQILC
jgi:hypothetical protein